MDIYWNTCDIQHPPPQGHHDVKRHGRHIRLPRAATLPFVEGLSFRRRNKVKDGVLWLHIAAILTTVES